MHVINVLLNSYVYHHCFKNCHMARVKRLAKYFSCGYTLNVMTQIMASWPLLSHKHFINKSNGIWYCK